MGTKGNRVLYASLLMIRYRYHVNLHQPTKVGMNFEIMM